MKKNILISILLLFLIPAFSWSKNFETTDGVEGYWVVYQKGKPASIMGVYLYEDVLYGKVMVSFEKDGSVHTPEDPSKADKLKGQPNMQGMDILWGGKKQVNPKNGQSRYVDARIMDPTGPKLYGAEVYRLEGDPDLRFRGSLLGASWLGSTMSWYPVEESLIPKGYSLPPLKSLRPVVYEEFKDK